MVRKPQKATHVPASVKISKSGSDELILTQEYGAEMLG
jgi:hypothetical protein